MTDALFPERLSDHCHGLCHTFSQICTKFAAEPLADPFAKLHQVRYTTPNKRTENQHIHPAM
jgi:hypothetical protein